MNPFARVGAMLAALLLSSPAVAALRCPPRLPGPHPGFEQVGPVPAAHWLLWGMQLFDAPPERSSMRELVPDLTNRSGDSYTMTWHLAGVASPLMICRYNGSGTYYRARPSPVPTTCVLRDDDGLKQGWCDEP